MMHDGSTSCANETILETSVLFHWFYIDPRVEDPAWAMGPCCAFTESELWPRSAWKDLSADIPYMFVSRSSLNTSTMKPITREPP